MLSWEGPPAQVTPTYNPQILHLLGHSCSAHMLTSIFLNSSEVSPSLTPSVTLLRAVKGIALSEGIYNLDSLLAIERFSHYREWFIAPTFGRRNSYDAFTTTRFPLWNRAISWLIIHSKGDTLVDVSQSGEMFAHLCRLYGLDAATRVHQNTNQLTAEHNDILYGDEYVNIIMGFVLGSTC